MFRYDNRRRIAIELLNKKSTPVQEEKKSQEPVIPETNPDVVDEKVQKKGRKKKEEVIPKEDVGDK